MKLSPISRPLAISARVSLIAIAFSLSVLADATGQASVPARKPDVIYLPTPLPVVERMLEMAEVKAGDVVYDLGCGDGRIVVTAAKQYGVKAVGFDIDPERVQEARANVRSNQLEHLVSIVEADIFTLDLREASVVTLYLLPRLNEQLMPQLAQLKPGSRIVSHNYDMRGATPVEVVRMRVDLNRTRGDEDRYLGDGQHTLYKWIVPWQPEHGRSSAPAAGSVAPATGETNAPPPVRAMNLSGWSPAPAKQRGSPRQTIAASPRSCR